VARMGRSAGLEMGRARQVGAGRDGSARLVGAGWEGVGLVGFVGVGRMGKARLVGAGWGGLEGIGQARRRGKTWQGSGSRVWVGLVGFVGVA
jgi:hypothetical protein